MVSSSSFIKSLAIHVARHPAPQLSFDPKKKNLVILGSGWAATSILERLDTLNYNVVCTVDYH